MSITEAPLIQGIISTLDFSTLRYPPLGADSVDNSEAFAQHLLAEADQSIESYNRSSSPPPHLLPISEGNTRPATPTDHAICGPHIHSPQAILRTPVQNTFLARQNSYSISPSLINFGLTQDISDSHSSSHNNSPAPIPFGTVEATGPSAQELEHVEESLFGAASSLLVPQAVLSPTPTTPRLPPLRVGNGSLASMRRAITPTPLVPFTAAVYIGFPLELHPAYSGFFEARVTLPSSTPSIAALITALRSRNNMLSACLNEVCSNLVPKSFCIAWSKTMVETNEKFNLCENGYFALGLLRDHLHSLIPVPRAAHNSVSIKTFEHFNVPLESPFFVLYCFPERVENAAEVPSPAAFPSSRTQTPAIAGHTARSHTPAATSTSGTTLRQFLSALRSNCTLLDQHFIAEAGRLVTLASAGYGTAYLHIRQVLVIQDVVRRASRLQSRTQWQHDVAAWAGIPPKTYANNLTFAGTARVLLQYLRERSPAQRQALSRDIRDKEDELIRIFSYLFRAEEIPIDWRESQSTVRSVGSVSQSDLKRIIDGYTIPAQQSKSLGAQLMTYC
ncbi:hypothetical protein R3P38DRAFT_3213831 [Favolaschia claudopus]|uniref:Uncharacterized protein n=1 Tax=Favolaschia claudopus TaxID=2862362 RepID=A0AAW0ABK3_9AGAR